jgi:hypothetical protein
MIDKDSEDKLEFKVEIKFFMDCPEDKIAALKDKLEDFGWWVCQEIKLEKALTNYPGTSQTSYDVVVTDLRGKV